MKVKLFYRKTPILVPGVGQFSNTYRFLIDLKSDLILFSIDPILIRYLYLKTGLPPGVFRYAQQKKAYFFVDDSLHDSAKSFVFRTTCYTIESTAPIL
jgi:hypothetical protein